MLHFSNPALNHWLFTTLCNHLWILIQVIQGKARMHIVWAGRVMAMRSFCSLVHRGVVARLIRGEHRWVQEHEVLLRAFIEIDWVGGVRQDLTLLEVRLCKQNFIDLKKGAFIVNEEVQEVISINLGEFFELDSSFGHLGQLAQSVLKFLAAFQWTFWDVTIERLADRVGYRLIDSGECISNTSGAYLLPWRHFSL